MTFLIAFLVYCATLCRTVYFGDSGELTAAAYDLGIPHPTGYPLYLLLVKGFATLVPIGSFALRANLFSALCAAGAAELLDRTLSRIGVPRVAAVAGGLAFAFLKPVWGEATVARTYALAALFSVTLLNVTVRYWQDPRPRGWMVHNLLLGLSLANHLMLIAHVPAFAVAVWMRERRKHTVKAHEVLASGASADTVLVPVAHVLARFAAQWKHVVMGCAAVLPGLAIYAYLPLRAKADPVLEYHAPIERDGRYEFHPLDEWTGLKSYLLRDLHQTHSWVGWEAKFAQEERANGLDADSPLLAKVKAYATIVRHHLWLLCHEWWYAGAGLIVVGAFALRARAHGPLVLVLALVWVFNLAPLSWHGAWWDIFLYPRYMTSGWVASAMLLGVGLGAVVERLRQRFAQRANLVQWGVLVFPALLLWFQYPSMDRSGFRLADDYARAILAGIPNQAQFFSAADQAIFPVMYRQVAERDRPDVRLVNPVQFRGKADWTGLVFTPDVTSEIPPGMKRVRRGLLYQVVPETRVDEGRPAVVTSPLRGMEDPTHFDEYSRSVVAQIEVALADIDALSGDLDSAMKRLCRVRDLDAPRTWGCLEGAMLTQRISTLPALELGREMLEAALRRGDPHDRVHESALIEQGNAFRTFGQNHRETNRQSAAAAFKHAAELVPGDPVLQKAYAKFLKDQGRTSEIDVHFQWMLDRYPKYRTKLKKVIAEVKG